MPRRINKDLKWVWGQAYWEQKATMIEKSYLKVLSQHLPDVPMTDVYRPSEHRFEDFIRRLSRKLKSGILHLGLTSSDLEDNIRAMRLIDSAKLLEHRLSSLWLKVAEMTVAPEKAYVAYTHLLPAGITSLHDRFAPLIEAFYHVDTPSIYLKGIRGSLGTRHVQQYLGIDEQELNNIMTDFNLSYRQQLYSCQTGNHMSEMNMAFWITAQTALLAKLANDIRQMFAFNQATNDNKDVASTALAHKLSPNPWRWEKISGMAELVYPIVPTVAHVLANCLLERTLTNQSALNELFQTAFTKLEQLIELAETAMSKLKFTPDAISSRMEEHLNSEYAVIDIVRKERIDRERAYNKVQSRLINLSK